MSGASQGSLATAALAFEAANAAHRRGDMAAAESGYRALLAAYPAHSEGWHMLGVLEAQRGNLPVAVKHFQKARHADPRNPGILGNLANALCELGGHAEALPLFARASEIDPGMPEPHCNMGQALRALGRPAEAVACYDRAIALRPGFTEAHVQRGAALAGLGRREEALRSLERAIALRPGHADAHLFRGNLLWDMGRREDGLVSFDRAVAASPGSAPAHCRRGNALRALGQAMDALAGADHAIRLDPGLAEGHRLRGTALSDLGRHADALTCLERALALQPDSVEAHNGRGNALHYLGRFAEALASFDKAVALMPGFAGAHANRGVALNDLGRPQEALEALHTAIGLDAQQVETFIARAGILQDLNRHSEALADLQRALDLRPGHAEAAWNQCMLQLLTGDFKRGWAQYDELRWGAVPGLVKLGFHGKAWHGGRVKGTLLAWGEQGIGDQVLQLGMAAELSRFAQRTLVAVSPRLVPLVRRSFPGLGVTALGQASGEPVEAQVPMGSLGRYLRKGWSDFPAGRPPWLLADAERARALRGAMPPGARLVCGISWRSGAPKFGAQKSMPLEELRPLLALEGVHAVDLQYTDTAAERADFTRRHGIGVSRVEGIDNFSDLDGLAALIEACDVVVTVSNTTAHLAGALGKPVFLMLPFSRGRLWYWHDGRDDSPWYPRTRLFRQASPGDWAGVAARVRDALSPLVRPSP